MRINGYWLSLLLAGLSVTTWAESTNETFVLGFGSDTEGEELTPIRELQPKPEKFDTFMQRMDFIHDNLQLSLHRHVEKVDRIMDDGKVVQVPTPPSMFRITPYLVLKEDSGLDVSLEPDFEMEVDLPNLENRYKVFFESSRNNELPGVDPAEREQSGQIGLRKVRKYFDIDVGVKVRWLPELFARIEWRPQWSIEHTVLQPKQRIFWESEDGFGSISSLTVHRWFGENKNLYWQSVSAAKYSTKKTDGVEFEQSLKLGLVKQALEKKWTWKNVLGTQDIARGHQLRYSIFANHDSDDGQINRHRLTYTYRKPLYKRWVYLEVAPGIEAENDNDWDLVPVLTVGIDMLFWGTYER